MDQGEIYSLPSSDPDSRDPKDGRPHIIVSLPSIDSEVVTVVYCSSESWEVSVNRPPHVIIDPSSATFATTGLTRKTVAYPGRLALCEPSDLDWYRGVLIDEMPALRTELLRAIGFRTGVSLSTGKKASGSLRGTVAQFTPEFKGYCGAELGLIISDPAYSRTMKFQNVIPLYPAGEFGKQEGVVELSLLSTGGVAFGKAEALPRLVQSCLHTADIASIVAHISSDDMTRIEDELAIRFFGSVIAAETTL